MNVAEIVDGYLKAHGFDGLYNGDAECACKAGNIAPCDYLSGACEAGYLAPCPPECGEHDWHVQAEKPKEKP